MIRLNEQKKKQQNRKEKRSTWRETYKILTVLHNNPHFLSINDGTLISFSVKIYLLFCDKKRLCFKEDTEKKLEFRKVFVGMSMESAAEPMNQLCIAMISKLENWGIINGMKESIGKH